MPVQTFTAGRNIHPASSCMLVVAAAATTLCVPFGHRLLAAGEVQGAADVIVGGIDGVAVFGSVTDGSTTTMAYAFGSTECNVGNVPLAENGASNQHAVIAQNLYRVKDGVIEQIGMSWVKHTVCALQAAVCGTCVPAGAGCPSALGVGCSSPTSASSSGSQSQLGPRSQVNASTGAFPFPVTGVPSAVPVIGRRCQVNGDDLSPALNAGASYFAECLYIQPEDALAGNGANNASYREVNVGAGMSGGAHMLSLTGPTVQQHCAVHAWASVVPGVVVTEVDAIDGRIVVGCSVTSRGAGLWRYEYAIYNLNSDASIGSVAVPVGSGASIAAQAFRDVAAHSGEPYDGADWEMSAANGQASWSTEAFSDNPSANALRWGTLYNYGFESNAPPVEGAISLGSFKVAGSTSVVTLVPGAAFAPSDLNHDGVVNGADLGMLLAAWGACSGCAADLNGSGSVDGADLGMLLTAFQP